MSHNCSPYYMTLPENRFKIGSKQALNRFETSNNCYRKQENDLIDLISLAELIIFRNFFKNNNSLEKNMNCET